MHLHGITFTYKLFDEEISLITSTAIFRKKTNTINTSVEQMNNLDTNENFGYTRSSNKLITEDTFLFSIRRLTVQSKVFKNIFIKYISKTIIAMS